MKTAIHRFVIPFAAGMLIGTAATLVLILRSPPPPPPSAPLPAASRPQPREDVALLKTLLAERDAANAALRAEIARLKAAAPTQATSPTPPAVASSPSGTATNSWLERLRVEDPERYRQIQAAREQRRQAVEEWFNSQFDRLDQRLQTTTTQEEADLVTRIAETLQQLEQLGQRWQEIRQLPDEQRRAAAMELGAETREAYRTLSELRAQDRQWQLEQLARQIGYRDERSAGQFVDSINAILKETEVNPMRGMGGMGRGGGRGSASPQP